MPKPYIPNDSWSKKAAEEGYRARSVYKLMELDERFRLLKPGMRVLDLAAAPGSWLQYESQRIGTKGLAIGIDLTEIKPVAENVVTFQADVTDLKTISPVLAEHLKQISQAPQTFDIVLSDIAPATSGIRDVDQWRSIELNQSVLEVAHQWLKPGGFCVLKVFRGADFDAFLREVKANWKDVRMAFAQASRDRSKEVYLVMRKT